MNNTRKAAESVIAAFDANTPAPQPVDADYLSTVMGLIDDYAKAVHDGDDSACVVLRRTIQASLQQPPAAQPYNLNPCYL